MTTGSQSRASKRRAQRNTTPRAQHKKDRVKEQDSELAKMVTLGEQTMNAKRALGHMKKHLQTLPAGNQRELILEGIKNMETLLRNTAMEKKLALNRVCDLSPPPPPMMQQKAQPVIAPLACPDNYHPMIMTAPGTPEHFNFTLYS